MFIVESFQNKSFSKGNGIFISSIVPRNNIRKKNGIIENKYISLSKYMFITAK